jgi:hypothetical protein
MSGYTDELERELIRAAGSYQRRRRFVGRLGRRGRRVSGSRPRLNFGGAFAFIASVSVVVAVVLVFVVFGHGGGPSTPSASPAGASQLTAMLAVLRQPQTAADRAVSPSEMRFLEASVGPLVTSLTRRVATIGPARIFLFVTKAREPDLQFAQNGPLWSASLGERVFVDSASTSAPNSQVPAAELRDPQVASGWYVEASTQKQYFLEVVPDGVTRVRIVFRDGTVDAAVSNNTVVALAPPRSNEQVRAVTWFGSSGQVIPTITEASDRAWHTALVAREAAARTSVIRQQAKVPNHAPAALVHDFAVFAADTETPVSAAGISVSHPSLASLPLEILQLVANPLAVREVSTQSGLRFWVDPGPIRLSEASGRVRELTDVCLRVEASPTLTGGCGRRLSTVLSSGLWAAAKPPNGPTVIYGIAPNTNQTVTFVLRGGGRRTVPLVHGIAVAPAAGVTQILVRGANGKLTSVQAPSPPHL